MSTPIAFLGCGSMNEAILAGLLKAGTAPSDVIVTVRRPGRAAELAARYPGLRALAVQEGPENKRAARGAAVVILGVEPARTVELAQEIGGALAPGTVVLSAAGTVTLAQLEAALPQGQPAARILSGTPLEARRSVVVLSSGSHCSPGQLTEVKGIFKGAGTVVEIPEEQMQAASVLSGSGPAYVYYLAEAMAAAGAELGLDPELSAVLARETVAGAGLMLAERGADASALRKSMASPNSITERALDVFDERGVPGIILAGTRAAAGRPDRN